MDELLALRALVGDSPRRDDAAQSEVWSRLSKGRRRRGDWRAPRRLVPAALVLGSVVLVAASLTLRSGSIGVETAEAACSQSGPAVTCLHALAELAGVGHATGQVAYQRRVDFRRVLRVGPPNVTGHFSVQQVWTQEIWVNRVTQRSAQRTSDGRMYFPTTADRAEWRASGSPTWRQMFGASPWRAHSWRTRHTNSIYNCNLKRAAGLVSADPEAVLRSLRSGAPVCDPKNPLLTPAQRASIFEALARSHVVRVLGRMRDPLGRHGVGIAYPPIPGHPQTWISIFSPSTSRLLAEGFRQPGYNGGRLTWLWAFLVDSAPAQRLLRTPN